MEKGEMIASLEQDINEVANLIWLYMDKKYVSQIKCKLDGYRRSCEQNLSREAQLLKAMMPFVPEGSKILQVILDLMLYNDMIEKSFEEYTELNTLYRDDNKDLEQVKKLMYKVIMFKLITVIENIDSAPKR